MVVLTPQTMTQIPETAEALGSSRRSTASRSSARFMGDAAIAPGVEVLRSLRACRTTRCPSGPWRPSPPCGSTATGSTRRRWPSRRSTSTATKVADAVRQDARRRPRDDGRRAKRATCWKPTASRCPSRAWPPPPDEAVRMAEEIGYPVVMKIASPDILHKSDIGGIKLNITSASEVRDAFDLLIYRGQALHARCDDLGLPDPADGQGRPRGHHRREPRPAVRPPDHVRPGRHLRRGAEGRDLPRRAASTAGRRPRCWTRSAPTSCCAACAARSRPTGRPSWTPCCASRQLVTDFPEIVELDINPLMVFEQGRGVLGIDMRLALK